MQAIRTNTIANVTTLRRSIQALSLEMVAFKSDPRVRHYGETLSCCQYKNMRVPVMCRLCFVSLDSARLFGSLAVPARHECVASGSRLPCNHGLVAAADLLTKIRRKRCTRRFEAALR